MGNRKKIFKNALRRRKGHSRVKSIFCSYKGSGFWSKHSHVSKSSVTAVPGDLNLASSLCCDQVFTWYIEACRSKTFSKIKKNI